jgi:hypothetical protein
MLPHPWRHSDAPQQLPPLRPDPDDELADLSRPADAEALLRPIKQKKFAGS